MILRLYLDEDSGRKRLVVAFRAAGVDILTTQEAGRLGEADDDQLAFAVSEGRALYTANKADFARLHSSYLAAGSRHAGIIICTWQEMSPERQVQRLLELIEGSGVQSLENQCLYVGPAAPKA